MAATKAAATLLAATSNGVGTTTAGAEINNSAGYDVLVTGRAVNGGTGPTNPVQMNVYTGTVTGEKFLFQSVAFDAGNSVTSDRAVLVPAAAMFINVDFNANTGQAVTVSSKAQELTGI